jgi:hypothetical protein
MNTKNQTTVYKVIVIVFFSILYLTCIGAVTKGIFLMRQPEFINPDKNSYFPVAIKTSSGIEIKNLTDVVKQESYVLACEDSLKIHCVGGNEKSPYSTYSLDYFDGDYRYIVQYISVGNKVYPVSKKIGSVADMLNAVLYVTGMFVLIAIITVVSGKLRRKCS